MSLADQQAFDSTEHTEPVTGELVLFTCPRHAGNLRLTETGCAGMFRRAQKADLSIDVASLHCRECEIGSKHANMACKPLGHQLHCVRCETRAMRLIGQLFCVSCANRAAEFIQGRNARGDPPVRYIPVRIFDYNDALIIVSRDVAEAGRMVERMQGVFESTLLVDYGLATPSEANYWWRCVILPWSRKARRPRYEFELKN